jgi:hypothetical protein
VVEVTGRMEGRMDNMSRDIKKVRLNSEVLWFSAPGMSFFSSTSNL